MAIRTTQLPLLGRCYEDHPRSKIPRPQSIQDASSQPANTHGRCQPTLLFALCPLRVASCLLLFALCALPLALLPPVLAQDATTQIPGLEELKKGDYDDAIKLLTKEAVSSPTAVEPHKLLLRAYRETGRYVEAEAAGRKFLLKVPDAGAVHLELAEILATTGRYDEAITEFQRARTDFDKSKSPASESLEADLRQAEVELLIGQEDRAKQTCQTLVTYYTDHSPKTAQELTPIARALVHLERFQDANDIYRAAIEADSTYIDAQLGAAELFTEKYNYADAAQFLEEARRINPNSARAALDAALNKRIEGGEEMMAALAQSLKINPNFVDALIFKASLAFGTEAFDSGTSDLDRALKINPKSLEAHSLRAAGLYLQDRDFQPEVNSTIAINPRYGLLFNTLSHFATMNRRTAQAARFARRAIEISPSLWDAHLNLGMALLRLGQMDEGRTEVEKAFKGDPFNLWAKNTLDLLDTMKDYRETRHNVFLIKTAAKESDVLSGYAGALLDEAAAKLTAKYKFTPQGPIAIEIFQNHEDFAVRTLGIPGLGALGVCFGQVVALDSPSARGTGDFNWGSTLWHEYTHVITLQMTDYRIPRWFSEGLSVFEERRARPGWGDDWNPMFVNSFAEGQWFKLADLDGGFQRPRRPQDINIAYFEASQICEFIVDRFGFEAILRMLALYRDKATTTDALRQVLKLTDAEFDQQFKAYVETKARPLHNALKTEANLAASLSKDDVLKMLATDDSFALRMRAGNLLAADGDVTGAVAHFKRAIELFPYYTGEGNAYERLAKILEDKGKQAQAVDVLEALTRQDENNLEALKNITRLRMLLHDQQRALAALRLSFYINPFDYASHTRAGELNWDARDYMQALSEFQVALALQPPNIAEANYNVASAYHALGKQPEAKRAVLRALEAAPRFEKAQELLLKIVGQ